ncbi:hypothetical protein BH11PLA1_BH11PLA1_10020 [soil metagenome]
MELETIRNWTLLVVGTFGASIFAGSEMGAYALNRVRLSLRTRSASARGTPALLSSAKTLAREVESPSRLLAALLLGYNFASYVAAEGLTGLLEGAGLGEWGVLLFTIFLATPVLFVVNDAAPKEIFRLRADRVMYVLAPMLRITRAVFQWTLILPFTQFVAARVASRIPGGSDPGTGGARQNMAELLKEGARHGVMSEAQVTLLDRAMSLRDTPVIDEVVPWSRCHVIDERWERSRVLELIARYPQTRFPLVSARGRVTGIVDAIDILTQPGKSPRDLATPVFELAPELGVREALTRMSAARARLAIVLQRGRPIGLVTAKDLIEPLTGELAAW